MGSLGERTRLSSTLNDLDIKIHSNLGADVILQAALDGFVEALHADAGDIKLLEDGCWTVRYEQGFGPEEVGTVLCAEEAPVAEDAARLQRPVVVSDFVSQSSVPYVGFPLRHALTATLAVPLVVRGEVIGCLFAWMRHTPREFSRGEIDFSRRMAASLALALENARLFEAETLARKQAEEAEHRLAEELRRTKVLLRASDELASSTDPDELVDRLAQVVLEATGISRVFINLIDLRQQVLIPKVPVDGLHAPRGNRIPLERLSTTSRDAIARGETALLDYEHPDVPEYDRDIARANSVRLALFVPLAHQGEVIGHITLDQPSERYEFTADQIRIVESIAAQASVALQNAQQFEREHRIAEAFQQALLAPPDHIEGIEIGLLYQAATPAARVGGDYYDVFEIDDDQVALIVGDVSGKGLEAAQLTALMRDGGRAYLLENPDPGWCLTQINSLAYRFTPSDKFATCFLGVLHRRTGVLRFCNAAHPAPIVIARDGARHMECLTTGLLGALPDLHFVSTETTLATDEVLVMITDGVTEARSDGKMFGEEGLVDALERLRGTSASKLPEALLSEVLCFAKGGLQDDVVIVCLSRTA
ncbi:MAG: SpoIIE family protein phosphatase [Coriobacteriia bacterium]